MPAEHNTISFVSPSGPLTKSAGERLGLETRSLILRISRFIGLLSLTIIARYFSSGIVEAGLYLIVLTLYFFSKDEAFWLAYFMTIATGFMGFFGNFQALLNVIPGLPGVEVVQFYIILTIVKAYQVPKAYRPFYMGFLQVLAIYMLFLIVEGFAVGFPAGLNRKFALIKIMLPMGLLYSIPILFDRIEKYRDAFQFLFIIAFSALFSQLFSISMGGQMPSEYFGATEHKHLFFDVMEGTTYRGFFSPQIVLITMFGAMVLIALRKGKNSILMYAVLMANFFTAFLSATRGWVVSFSVMLFFFILFILNVNPRQILGIGLGAMLALGMASTIPAVNMQIQNTVERLTTLEALAKGDITADGTLSRISKRGPRVMKAWSRSKLTGYGYSETYRQFRDPHVGNQDILLQGGIVGLVLLYAFFFFFNFKLWLQSRRLGMGEPLRYGLLVFPIFFLGWFFIHSSSTQQFGFSYEPVKGIQLALFFGLGSQMYAKAEEIIRAAREAKKETMLLAGNKTKA